MSQRLTAGGIFLAKRPLPIPIPASYTTTLSIWRPSATLSSGRRHLHLQKEANPKEKASWSKFLALHPTSLDQVQTVYNACSLSRVFTAAPQPVTELKKAPIGKPTAETAGVPLISDVEATFRNTPGLQPQDWKAKGIDFHHAVHIADQLQRTRKFTEGWDSDAGLPPTSQTRELARLPGNKKPPSKGPAVDGDKGDVFLTLRQAVKLRKKAELASDAAEGIKSKRRPLRVAASSQDSSMWSKDKDKLRRMERHGREVILDKQSKRPRKKKAR